MVRFTVLASGSKGNSTVVTGGRTRILVDAGLSCRELFRRMRLAGEEPETLDAIIVTHEHSDHVGGLAVTARKLGIPVYFTEGTHRAWMRWLTPRRQMTYAQWVEQCRRAAAEKQADEAAPACDPTGDLDAALEAASEAEAPAAPIALAMPQSVLQLPLRKNPIRKENPTWLPGVEYFKAGEPFSIGDLAVSPSPFPMTRPTRRFRLLRRWRAHGLRHRPRLHSAQREGAAQRRRFAVA